MIASHKVLAAYACLAPRIVTGQFDPSSQRAVWPSTGNYCRGGVAISRTKVLVYMLTAAFADDPPGCTSSTTLP